VNKAIILIDGSNFYFKLKSIGIKNQLTFDYKKLAKFLVGKDNLISSTYYIGKVKTDKTTKSQKLHRNQQKLLAQLRKHNFSYKLGYLLKNGGKYHEKGVDIQMAVDLLVAAYENTADRIILVSSDTDLIPAIRKAKAMGKTVEYVGFSHQKSIALVAECNESRLLKLEDIEIFCKNDKNK
jgi:uncharacterized LabA/DUF88 family protein